MTKLDYLSDHLKATRRDLDGHRHGGIVLSGDELDAFVGLFDNFITMSIALENEVSKAWWNQRAAADRQRVADARSVAIAQPNSNIFAFPARRPSTGGDAA